MLEAVVRLLAGAGSAVLVLCAGLVAVYLLLPAMLLSLFNRFQICRAGFRWRSVSVGQQRFCYMERGVSGRGKNSLLLLHGFTSQKAMWCEMAKVLPRSYHLIAVDLPGHGNSTRNLHDDYSISSQAEKLHQFIQAIGLDKTAFHLVGISMGGHIAGVYAAVHGQTSLLQSLVLLCPAGIDAPQLSSFISNVAQGGKNYLLPETPREISVMVTKVFFKDVQLPYFMARMMNEERRPWQDLYKKILEDIAHPDQRFLLHSKLTNIVAPTLVLWGEHDQILDVSAVDVIREKVPHWEVHILERCGHAMSLERPCKAAKLLRQFIARQEEDQ